MLEFKYYGKYELASHGHASQSSRFPFGHGINETYSLHVQCPVNAPHNHGIRYISFRVNYELDYYLALDTLLPGFLRIDKVFSDPFCETSISAGKLSLLLHTKNVPAPRVLPLP